MFFKPASFVIAAASAFVFTACSARAPSSHHHSVLGEEQGYYSKDEDSHVRPVEGFHQGPDIQIPARPVVDNYVDTDPAPRPGVERLERLSGYSLRQINEALNNHAEGERVSWYEDREQYQMRIDTHAYLRNNRACKDVLILKKRNNRHSEWRRHYATFCRAAPNAPWKLQY